MIRLSVVLQGPLMIAALAFPCAARAGLVMGGHAHAGVCFEEGQFDLHFGAEDAVIDGVERTAELAPQDLVVLVPVSTRQTAPTGTAYPAWAFLGVPEGGSYYRLSASVIDCYAEGTAYFGFGTEEMDFGMLQDDRVTFALTRVVAAPADGHFSIYRPGPTRDMDTADETPPKQPPRTPFDNDQIALSVYTHGHYAFAFSKPGVYQLEITASAWLSPSLGGGNVSDSAIFTFDVPGADIVIGIWQPPGLGGNWGDAGKWDAGVPSIPGVPDARGDFAILAKATAPATEVALGAARTVARLSLSVDPESADPQAGYKLVPGANGELVLDRGAEPAWITAGPGEHEIAVPVTLASNSGVYAASASSLLVSGDLTGDKRLTKTGEGLLALSGSNTFSGGIEVQGGTLMVASVEGLPPGGGLAIHGGGAVVLTAGLGGAAMAARVPADAPIPVPEPAALALVLAGVVTLAARRPFRFTLTEGRLFV